MMIVILTMLMMKVMMMRMMIMMMMVIPLLITGLLPVRMSMSSIASIDAIGARPLRILRIIFRTVASLCPRFLVPTYDDNYSCNWASPKPMLRTVTTTIKDQVTDYILQIMQLHNLWVRKWHKRRCPLHS